MPEKIKVLIVDDSITSRKVIAAILKTDPKFAMEEAENSKEAIEWIKKKGFNIAIVDYALPDKDGIALTRNIKELNNDIQIIILTGHPSIESAMKAVKEDIYDYLTKPVEPDRFIEVINNALEKQHLLMENKRLLWELKKTNVELGKLDKFKSGLIAMMSNDLIPPINLINAFNTSLLEGKAGELTQEQREIVKTEAEAINAMVGLMDNLVDIRQIEAGELQIKKKLSDIKKTVIQPVIKRLTPQINKNKIKININYEKNLPEVNMDTGKISQVMQNLLQNAIKFNSENGNIDVMVSVSDNHMKVSITDDGKGIHRDLLNKVFEIFYTSDTSGIDRDRKEPAGRGMGLAICREIINAHGGKILAESKGEGEGSTFIFIIPINE